jgi:hypothetical protein
MNVERVISGKLVKMMAGDYRELPFMLNDKSTMRVAMCEKDFRAYMKASDEDKLKLDKDIMECVYNGWEWATQVLVADGSKPKWTDAHRKEYLEEQAKLNILTVAEGKHRDELDKVYNKSMEEKNRRNTKKGKE